MPRHNGGLWVTSKGYLWVKLPPGHVCERAGGKGYGPLHLLVFWHFHGRLPDDGWHIHHHDENKWNNEPSNLQEREGGEHGRYHLPRGSERARRLGRLGGKAAARARRKRQRALGRKRDRASTRQAKRERKSKWT